MSSVGKAVIAQEIAGLQALHESLSVESFEGAVRAIRGSASGILVLTGIGKSGHVASKLASTFTSLGTPAVFVHPVEALHGDMRILTRTNCLVALSRSGTAQDVADFCDAACRLGISVVAITEDPTSSVALLSDVTLPLPDVAEAWGHAPTTSTIMQMALGDALAVAVAEKNGFTAHDFKLSHPGGALGHK